MIRTRCGSLKIAELGYARVSQKYSYSCLLLSADFLALSCVHVYVYGSIVTCACVLACRSYRYLYYVATASKGKHLILEEGWIKLWK